METDICILPHHVRGKHVRTAIGYQLLRIYHTTAHIMAGTSISPIDEPTFDSYTAHFTSIVHYTRAVLKASEPLGYNDVQPEQNPRQFSFTMDMGIIPLLYFVAVNCRVLGVRRQAIELLANASYQEGLWNSSLAAAAAAEIMRIEENIVMRYTSIASPVSEDAVSVPFVSGKLYGMRVELPDTPSGKLTVIGDRRCMDESWETVARQYDLINCV